MSFPFRSGLQPAVFNRLVEHLRSITERFPDSRTGDNTQYSMADAAMGAFSVFFMQSPSFLDAQRTLQVTKGCNNTQTLFGLAQIPSDNHIRNLLDGVPPANFFQFFPLLRMGSMRQGTWLFTVQSAAICWWRWMVPSILFRQRSIATNAALSSTKMGLRPILILRLRR